MLVINNKDSSLGISPFFATYSYHVEPVEPTTLANDDGVATEEVGN